MAAGAFFGHSAQTSKHCWKKFLGRMFPAIYNFSIFSIRDFDGQVATVNCSSNNDLTNILATTLSATSDFNPLLNNTGHYFTFVIIILWKLSHVWENFCHNLSPAYSTLELCLNVIFIKPNNFSHNLSPAYSTLELCLTNYLLRFEISLRGKVSLCCKVTSLFTFTSV